MKLRYGLLALAGLGLAGSGCATTQKYPVATVIKDALGYEANVKLIDSNNDKKPDMIQLKMKNNILKREQEQLYVDKDFDDNLDAVLLDAFTAEGKRGVDGIYDIEMPFEAMFNMIQKRPPTKEESTVEGFHQFMLKDFSEK